MNYVIGVDIGTQSTKALLVDQHGTIVAQHASSYQPDTPRPLWAEQWPAVWFKAVVECIAACVDQGERSGRRDAVDQGRLREQPVRRLGYSSRQRNAPARTMPDLDGSTRDA